jgi:hypothetical protein
MLGLLLQMLALPGCPSGQRYRVQQLRRPTDLLMKVGVQSTCRRAATAKDYKTGRLEERVLDSAKKLAEFA